LDALTRFRRLQTVTISGGEPLLHPELCRIVESIRNRGIYPAVITNGILLDENMSENLRRAGCKIVLLHIQEGQARPDLPEASAAAALLEEKGSLLRRHGIVAAAAATLEPSDVGGFRKVASAFAQSGVFEYLFITVARDFRVFADPRAEAPDVDDKPLLATLENAGFRPYAFIGGRIDRNRPRVRIFHSVARRDRRGRVAGWAVLRASALERIFMAAHRWATGRSLFLSKSSSARIKLRMSLNALMGGRLSGLPFALRALVRGEELQDKHILLELPPFRRPDGRLEWCEDCPDMTHRDGAFVPVCLHDVITPETYETETKR